MGKEKEEEPAGEDDGVHYDIKLRVCGSAGNDSSTRMVSLGVEVRMPERHGEMEERSVDHGGSGALAAALDRIRAELERRALSWDDALFVHLYVPSMQHFGNVNAVYGRFLPPIDPPARATVQLVRSSGGVVLAVEVLAARGARTVEEVGPAAACEDIDDLHRKKRVLHVQSVSEWAPSCIGPYSQAVSHRGLVYFAGQIPLDPASMTITPRCMADPAAATARALSSCQAVAIAVKTDLRRASLWWTVFVSSHNGDEGEGGAGGDGEAAAAATTSAAATLADFLNEKKGVGSDDDVDNDNDDDCLESDDYLCPPHLPRREGWSPPVTFIRVPSLPRNALVELQPVAWSEYGMPDASTSSSSSDDDDDDSGGGRGREAPWGLDAVESSSIGDTAMGFTIQDVRVAGRLFRGTAFVFDQAKAGGAAEALAARLMAAGLDPSADVVGIKMYATGRGAESEAQRAVEGVLCSTSERMSVVPVEHVSCDSEGQSAALAVELLAVRE